MVGIGEIRGGLVGVARRIVVVEQLVDLAGVERVLAVEIVDAVGRLDEQVIDVDLLALVAGLDRVAVEAVGADELSRVVGRFQDVGLAELIGAEVERQLAGGAARDGAGIGGVGADGNVREGLAFRRGLAALIVAHGDARFGRETVRPFGIELEGVVVLVFRLRVPVGIQVQCRG